MGLTIGKIYSVLKAAKDFKEALFHLHEEIVEISRRVKDEQLTNEEALQNILVLSDPSVALRDCLDSIAIVEREFGYYESRARQNAARRKYMDKRREKLGIKSQEERREEEMALLWSEERELREKKRREEMEAEAEGVRFKIGDIVTLHDDGECKFTITDINSDGKITISDNRMCMTVEEDLLKFAHLETGKEKL